MSDTTSPAPLGPGLHLDVPAERYHADPCAEPSLSSSIAHTLVIETPRHAWFSHPRLNPAFEASEPNAAMAIGKVAHEMILGRGGGIVVVEADDWRTNKAKDARTAAESTGKTAVLRKTMAEAERIREAVLLCIRETPEAVDFYHADAHSEVVGIWRDIGGPMCRIMVDRLSPEGVVYDLKITARGLDDVALGRALEDGYACRGAFYIRGLERIDPAMAGRFRYRWIFAESTAPYAVRIVEADARTLALGDRQAALGIATWQRCLTTNTWPGWPRRVAQIGMGTWADARIAGREAVSTFPEPLALALSAGTAADHL